MKRTPWLPSLLYISNEESRATVRLLKRLDKWGGLSPRDIDDAMFRLTDAQDPHAAVCLLAHKNTQDHHCQNLMRFLLKTWNIAEVKDVILHKLPQTNTIMTVELASRLVRECRKKHLVELLKCIETKIGADTIMWREENPWRVAEILLVAAHAPELHRFVYNVVEMLVQSDSYPALQELCKQGFHETTMFQTLKYATWWVHIVHGPKSQLQPDSTTVSSWLELCVAKHEDVVLSEVDRKIWKLYNRGEPLDSEGVVSYLKIVSKKVTDPEVLFQYFRRMQKAGMPCRSLEASNILMTEIMNSRRYKYALDVALYLLKHGYPFRGFPFMHTYIAAGKTGSYYAFSIINDYLSAYLQSHPESEHCFDNHGKLCQKKMTIAGITWPYACWAIMTAYTNKLNSTIPLLQASDLPVFAHAIIDICDIMVRNDRLEDAMVLYTKLQDDPGDQLAENEILEYFCILCSRYRRPDAAQYISALMQRYFRNGDNSHLLQLLNYAQSRGFLNYVFTKNKIYDFTDLGPGEVYGLTISMAKKLKRRCFFTIRVNQDEYDLLFSRIMFYLYLYKVKKEINNTISIHM